MVAIRKVSCPSDKIKIKCPYTMTPTRIVIHNTANDASANNEIAYMHRNNNEVSFHFAVDDIEIVQGIELNRNAWHASDGGNGKGNREGIAIEICYSKSGGERWLKAVKNAAELTAKLLNDYGWGIDKVTKHQDYGNHKHCPHRILDEYGWDKFIALINSYINPGDEIAEESNKITSGNDGVKTVMIEMPILKKGAKCEEVKTLQVLLNGFNKAGLAVDGLFGQATDKAVRNYQRSRGLDIDGICGSATWNRILK